jgi:hypothetical protein
MMGAVFGFVFALFTTFIMRLLDKSDSIRTQREMAETYLRICLTCLEAGDHSKSKEAFFKYYEIVPKVELASDKLKVILDIYIEMVKINNGENGDVEACEGFLRNLLNTTL